MNIQRANHRLIELNRAQHDRKSIDLALAAIWAALNHDAVVGWNDWNQYAALGENCI